MIKLEMLVKRSPHLFLLLKKREAESSIDTEDETGRKRPGKNLSQPFSPCLLFGEVFILK
ncbi:hypothetical protein [Methanocalculus sp. MC3]